MSEMAPEDRNELKSDVMQGASRSIQDLRNHVGIGSFIENLLTASFTIRHTLSDVTGANERKRSPIGMSHTSGAGAPSVAGLTSEIFWSKKSSKASAERPVVGCKAPSPPLPSPSLIVRQRDADTMGACSTSIYALRVLRAHGLPPAMLHKVDRATALARLIFLSSLVGFLQRKRKGTDLKDLT